MPTLTALNAFRYTNQLNHEPALEKAVEFLLENWMIRMPIGPYHNLKESFKQNHKKVIS